MPFGDLALLNLRGDLGLVDGGIGCSDLAWRRERSVIEQPVAIPLADLAEGHPRAQRPLPPARF